ncbi:MAG: CocE/NonD family hydrolase [Candidatus Eisenbacteria bacterium]|nr:CocE/NonD family hydrolase [Candidatus Eisenbacteria bacterium]
MIQSGCLSQRGSPSCIGLPAAGKASTGMERNPFNNSFLGSSPMRSSRRRVVLAVVLLILVSVPLSPDATQEHAPDADRDRLLEVFQIPMSDGVHLHTYVHYPPGSGPWPVILYRTPYGISSDHIGYVTEHGYVGVSQDTRGRFGSEGIDRMFRDDGWGPDHQDGRETVDWILQQSWCDGRIGTLGGSARGITQNMLAASLPDSVRCMHVVVAPANMYEHVAFPGGAFRQRDVEGWLNGQGSPHMIDSIYAHPNHDAWWSWWDTEARHPLESIPTYQVGGWFDLFAQGQIDSYNGLQLGGGPGARGNQKLIMGPWSHGSMGGGQCGELFFPDAGVGAAEALIGYQGDWFDFWMHEIPNGIMELPPIAYYVMGNCDDPGAPGNAWRAADRWPPAHEPLLLYLRAGGGLSPTPPGSEAPQSYDFDPQDPVPTLGGGNLIGESGPYDQSSTFSRPDVLVYQAEPLEAPLESSGPVRAVLYIASDGPDTDFTAKLCDVYPDGRAMLVCDGILRARHRLSMESEDFLVPGEIYRIEIDLWDTSIIFDAGHRILLAVSSSNHPRFDVNPNTGEPFMQHHSMRVAHNTIHHDSQHASYLRLSLPLPPQSSPGPRIVAAGPRVIRTLRWGPSPLHGAAAIEFVLAAPRPVSLRIHDAAGRRVCTLANRRLLGAGRHCLTWDGRDALGRAAPAGAYYLRLEAEGDARTRSLVRVD